MVGATPRVRLILTPVLKLAIAVAGLLVLQTLVSALAMVREIPVPSGLPLPVLEIVKVVIATVILVLVVNFAFEIGDNLEVAFPAFPQGGAIARWFLLLVAVLIAYGAYRALAETFLGDYAWMYALVFLGLALAPLIKIVLLSYQNIDKLTGVAVAGMQTLGAGGEARRAKGQLQCASCGMEFNPGTKFCRGCGAPAPVQNTAEVAPLQYSQCGVTLSAGSKFCPECGTQVPTAQV